MLNRKKAVLVSIMCAGSILLSSCGGNSQITTDNKIANSNTSESNTTDNKTSENKSTDNKTADGQNADGKSTGNKTADGQKTDGMSTGNKTADGQKTDGKSTDNKAADGQTTDGRTDLLYLDALNGNGGAGDGKTDKTENKLNSDNSLKTDFGKVYDVVKGTFDKEQFVLGEVCYEDVWYDSIEANEANLIEFKVNEGDFVKKGDEILTYECVYDKAEQKQKELDVERMEKEYSAGLHQRQAEIKAIKNELKNLKDSSERKIKKIELEKMKHSLIKFEATKKRVDEAREDLNEYIAGNKSGSIRASKDGYVIELTKPEEDSTYKKGDSIVKYSMKEKFHIEAEDDVSTGIGPRYGSTVKVVVEGQKGQDNITVSGIVKSANNIQSTENMQGRVYVELLEKPQNVNWSNNIKVYYTHLKVEDAIIVPFGAVQTETTGGGTETEETPFVYVYENDVPQKRYVRVVDENSDYYRIAEGVSEGDKIAVFD